MLELWSLKFIWNVSPGYDQHEQGFKKTLVHLDISLMFVHVSPLKTYDPLTFIMKIIHSKLKVYFDVLSASFKCITEYKRALVNG